MLSEMTFREGIRLRGALRLAFRSRTALDQVVFDRLGQKLSALATGSDYEEVLTSLILWSEQSGKTAALIAGARNANPGEPMLAEFSVDYSAKHQENGAGVLPPKVLTRPHRTALIAAVQRLAPTASYNGRSAYLIGIRSNLRRDESNEQVDLDLMLDQLDGLGRLTGGLWPLLLFIDNVLAYASASADVTEALQTVRRDLVLAYGGE